MIYYYFTIIKKTCYFHHSFMVLKTNILKYLGSPNRANDMVYL